MSVAVPNPQELSRLVSEWIDPAEKPTEHPVVAAKPRSNSPAFPAAPSLARSPSTSASPQDEQQLANPSLVRPLN